MESDYTYSCPTLEEHLSIIRSNEPTKKRSTRRRAPQKPGLTAKGEIRHFVQHNYQDHSQDPDVMGDTGVLPSPLPLDSFPVKLFHMLNAVEESGRSDVVSWLPHGRAFLVHKPKTFVQQILPRYFSQSKLTSFQRQLNLYGFTRLTRGPDDGGYYHECFLRGKYFLVKKIARTKVKGTKYKATSSPESEPDFYSMPFVAVNPIVVTSPKAEYSDKQMGISMKRELTNAHSGIRSHLTAPNRMIHHTRSIPVISRDNNTCGIPNGPACTLYNRTEHDDSQSFYQSPRNGSLLRRMTVDNPRSSENHIGKNVASLQRPGTGSILSHPFASSSHEQLPRNGSLLRRMAVDNPRSSGNHSEKNVASLQRPGTGSISSRPFASSSHEQLPRNGSLLRRMAVDHLEKNVASLQRPRTGSISSRPFASSSHELLNDLAFIYGSDRALPLYFQQPRLQEMDLSNSALARYPNILQNRADKCAYSFCNLNDRAVAFQRPTPTDSLRSFAHYDGSVHASNNSSDERILQSSMYLNLPPLPVQVSIVDRPKPTSAQLLQNQSRTRLHSVDSFNPSIKTCIDADPCQSMSL